MAVLKRIHYNTPVVLTFFFLSLAALLLGALTGGWTTQAFFSVYRSPLTDPLGYVRLFGHVLGHAGYEHFAGNMLLFLVIGPPMEEKYGSKVLLTGILLTALISGLLQCIFFSFHRAVWSKRYCVYARYAFLPGGDERGESPPDADPGCHPISRTGGVRRSLCSGQCSAFYASGRWRLRHRFWIRRRAKEAIKKRQVFDSRKKSSGKPLRFPEDSSF